MNENDTVTIFGANGFLGSYLVNVIAKTGARINLVTRSLPIDAKRFLCGSVGQIAYMKFSDSRESLRRVVLGSTYVVNLIGALSGSEKEMEYANVSIPRKIAEMAKHAKVKKFLHVSALCADLKLKSHYVKSKLKGERAVFNELHDAIILRPALMIGREDGFLDPFLNMAKISPIIPIIGGEKLKLQPICVEDVALCIYNAITSKYSSSVCGKVISVAGPHTCSIKEIIELALKQNGASRVSINVPSWAAGLKASILHKLGLIKINSEHIKLLTVNNTLGKGHNGAYQLGVSPNPIHDIIRYKMLYNRC